MFTKDIGIDLGTANTIVYLKGKGIVIREPSVVAVDIRTDTVKNVGQEAKDVIGRAPGTVSIVRPLREGVIADFDVTISMLQEFINRALLGSRLNRARVVICIPTGVSPVERRAVRDATLKAGAKKVIIVEEPMAAAIGSGLPTSDPTGSMVVDIGGGTTEVAVISLGGIVAASSIRIGGDSFDQHIIAYIKKKHSILIGERTAEQIKIDIGAAQQLNEPLEISIVGRNLLEGLPQSVLINSNEVAIALNEPIREILESIRVTLEKTPPELAADIIDQGIMLTGGGAMLRGLNTLIEKETGISVLIAENPLDCVALGTGIIIENINKLSSALTNDEISY